jgi:hypothetical protein
MPRFTSTAAPGYSDVVRKYPGSLLARKLEQPLRVRFATEDCLIESQEGSVHAKVGDAILTGVHGEQWRVSKAHFSEKYRPVAPTLAGHDGTYVTNALPVLAVQMREPFDVLLADKRSTLSGESGDWLVDYGDGSLGIVSQAIFPMTYEIVT